MFKTISSKPLGKRSWFWRQMATQAERRKINFKAVLLYPLLKTFYRRKHTLSHVAPILVIGKNTWLNSLIVWKLSFNHSEIWVWDIKGIDWWNYNMLQTKTFLTWCQNKFPNFRFNSIENLLKYMRQQACEQSKIYFISNDNLTPWEIFMDEYTNGWVLKLTNGKWPPMSGILEHGDQRRLNKEKIEGSWSSAGATNAIWTSKMNQNSDDAIPCHYLLASRAIWTSLPPKGVKIEAHLEGDYQYFEFNGNESYGCARKIAQTPESFFNHPYTDTRDVINNVK